MKKRKLSNQKEQFENLKRYTGLKGWQIYLISTVTFLIALVLMFLFIFRPA